MKARGLGWKENSWICIDQRQALTILENYVMELYGQATRSEHLEAKCKEEATADKKGP